MVEPVDPSQRGELDSFERPPWSSPVDDFGLVKAIDRLGQSVVIAIADAADRWFDPGFGKPFGATDREILVGAIGVRDEAAAAGRPPRLECLLQGIQDKAGARGA